MHLLFLRFFDPETNKFTKTSAGSKNSVLSKYFQESTVQAFRWVPLPQLFVCLLGVDLCGPWF